MDTPSLQRVTRTVKRIAPLKAGIMLGVIYALLGCIVLPFFLIAAMVSKATGAAGGGMLALGAGFALCIPILYGCLGFIGGVLSSFIYNVVAKWVGGIEFEVE
ncbi:MAG TPA: hypothetical protein VII43_05215 [Opitutaceae bacterium]